MRNIVQRVVFTTASTVITDSVFTQTELVRDLISSDRVFQFENVDVTLSWQNATGSLYQMQALLLWTDTVTGVQVPCTNTKQLSTTVGTKLSFRIPERMRYYVGLGSPVSFLTLRIMVPAMPPIQQFIVATVEPTIYLSDDTPQQV